MDACLGLFAMQIGAGVFFALELQKMIEQTISKVISWATHLFK
jgi:hypothetical protein